MSLSRKQNLVLPLLVQGMTLEEISKKMGITRQTLHAWIKNDEFTAQLELERNRIRQDALNKIENLLGKAVDELNILLGDESSNIRLKAIQLVINFAWKKIEQQELEERLRVLEEALNRQKNGGRSY